MAGSRSVWDDNAIPSLLGRLDTILPVLFCETAYRYVAGPVRIIIYACRAVFVRFSLGGVRVSTADYSDYSGRGSCEIGTVE